jgi:hypothetical protein
MWRVNGKRGGQWRASLEIPGRGERHEFLSLDHLIAFLRVQTGHPENDNQEEEFGEYCFRMKGK